MDIKELYREIKSLRHHKLERTPYESAREDTLDEVIELLIALEKNQNKEIAEKKSLRTRPPGYYAYNVSEGMKPPEPYPEIKKHT